MKSNRNICIHCHFYQPPRENPWLDEIEYQDSAYPYHDWNERINAECYRPNGESRILDDDGYLLRLKNNYAGISFNFGPTLLSWLEKHDPATYAAILEGDRLSRERFGGHGNAIAQVYNHMIMPLADRRDKETQIRWGLRDFEHRFGRKAEAMWLAETAIDLETLEIMEAHGLSYVILAPRQARSVRAPEDSEWQELENEDIDTSRPYRLTLPNGRTIAVFFYNGYISRAVAFEGLLHNGRDFARRMMDYFPDGGDPFLLNIATDGESYGHHHRHGDMALACALQDIDNDPDYRLTNYGLYLEEHPPQWEIKIHENSSWSCIHGIGRWNDDCGCHSGHREDWNQQWRKPLRESFDHLRDHLSVLYMDLLSAYTDDPWAMRDDYISILLEPGDEVKERFFQKWCKATLSPEDREKILKWMEIQKNLLFMYTSCGWFFDEVSGIETVQNIQYACRAIELADGLFENTIETEFIRNLEEVPSNIPEISNARILYERYIKPSKIVFSKLAAQFAAALILDIDYKIGTYRFRPGKIDRKDDATLIQGKLESRLLPTPYHFTAHITYTAIPDIRIVIEDDREAFSHYGFSDLLLDLRRKSLKKIYLQAEKKVEKQFSDIFSTQYKSLEQLYTNNADLPPVTFPLIRHSFNHRLAEKINRPGIDLQDIQNDIDTVLAWGADFDQITIHEICNRALTSSCKNFQKIDDLRHFLAILQIYRHFPFPMEPGDLQNDFYKWYRMQRETPFAGNDEWMDCIKQVSEILKVSLDEQA